MVQEIITYIIVGAAIAITFLKFKKRFLKKKKVVNTADKNNHTQNKCADCSADCMLRNSINPTKSSDVEICEKTKKRN